MERIIPYLIIVTLFLGLMSIVYLEVDLTRELKQMVGKEVVVSGDTLKVIGVDYDDSQLIMDDGTLLSRHFVKAFLDQ